MCFGSSRSHGLHFAQEDPLGVPRYDHQKGGDQTHRCRQLEGELEGILILFLHQLIDADAQHEECCRHQPGGDGMQRTGTTRAD